MNKHDQTSYRTLLILLVLVFCVGLAITYVVIEVNIGVWTSNGGKIFGITAAIQFLFFLLSLLYLLQVTRYAKNIGTMKRTLISNVNHELKTPITSIRAMAEVLYDGMEEDPQKQHEYLALILSETERMEQLVLDMQTLQKLQSQHIVFEKRKCSVDEILLPLLDRYEMLCMDLKLKLDVVDIDRLSSVNLFTAPEKLSSVFDILLNNATKYTPEGGSISIRCAVKSNKAIFCIQDNGIGIAEEDQTRIFERFYRADKSRHTTGSGLGLAIAYNILNGLHEEIWVESKQNVGSAFYFTVDIL